MLFRLKRQQKYKAASVTSISEADILNALPKDEDFRQSLILPSLARQFPFLLNPDEPVCDPYICSSPRHLDLFSYRVPIPEMQAMPSKPLSVLTGANATQIWNSPQEIYHTQPSDGSTQSGFHTDDTDEPNDVDLSNSRLRQSISSSTSQQGTPQSMSSMRDEVVIECAGDANMPNAVSINVPMRPPSTMATHSSDTDSCPCTVATTILEVTENDESTWAPSLSTLVKRHLRNLSQSTIISEKRGHSAEIAKDVEQPRSLESQLDDDLLEEYRRRSRSQSTGAVTDSSSAAHKFAQVPEILLDRRTSLVWKGHRRHIDSHTGRNDATVYFARGRFIAEKIASLPVRNEVSVPEIPPRNPLRTISYYHLPKTPWPLVEQGAVTLVNLPIEDDISPTSTLAPSPVTPTSAVAPSLASSPTSISSTFNSLGSKRGSATIHSNKTARQHIRTQDISSPVFISSTYLDPSIPIQQIDYHKMKYRHTLTVA
ncbi:hypothetical protein V1525DRAFT_155144 [Lipomyces kononenkoae]|uniref:Uncharacterized protein n=1 Tax=Lipomyces kononenkoae TaxID=34357 RepID=A0ACC3T109_LIPKO